MNRDTDATRQAIIAAGHPDKTDPATIELVRNCLPGRLRTPAARPDLEHLACDVAVIMTDLVSKPHEARYLCVTLGLTVPPWLTANYQPAPWSAIRPHILQTLSVAFPHRRFTLIGGRGPAAGTLLVQWVGSPQEGSVRDVLAQYERTSRPDGLREILCLRTARP